MYNYRFKEFIGVKLRRLPIMHFHPALPFIDKAYRAKEYAKVMSLVDWTNSIAQNLYEAHYHLLIAFYYLERYSLQDMGPYLGEPHVTFQLKVVPVKSPWELPDRSFKEWHVRFNVEQSCSKLFSALDKLAGYLNEYYKLNMSRVYFNDNFIKKVSTTTIWSNIEPAFNDLMQFRNQLNEFRNNVIHNKDPKTPSLEELGEQFPVGVEPKQYNYLAVLRTCANFYLSLCKGFEITSKQLLLYVEQHYPSCGQSIRPGSISLYADEQGGGLAVKIGEDKTK